MQPKSFVTSTFGMYSFVSRVSKFWAPTPRNCLARRAPWCNPPHKAVSFGDRTSSRSSRGRDQLNQFASPSYLPWQSFGSSHFRFQQPTPHAYTSSHAPAYALACRRRCLLHLVRSERFLGGQRESWSTATTRRSFSCAGNTRRPVLSFWNRY